MAAWIQGLCGQELGECGENLWYGGNVKPYFETELGKLYHGDCLDVLQGVENNSIDLIITDPPFRINSVAPATGYYKRREAQFSKLNEAGANLNFSIFPYLECFKKKMKKFVGYFWTSKGLLPEYFEFIKRNKYLFNVLIWEKINAPPMIRKNFHPNIEYLIYIKEPKSEMFNSNLPFEYYSKVFKSSAMKMTYHPCEKPYRAIYPYILISSMPGDLILDPFSGSGTGYISAEVAGRRWIAIEKIEEYCRGSVQKFKKDSFLPSLNFQQKKLQFSNSRRQCD